MKSNHTPEPWRIYQNDITPLAAVGNDGAIPPLFKCSKSNAQRIVACVNGCKGIDDPENTVPELVKALKDMVDAFGHYCEGDPSADEVETLQAALAILSKITNN